MTHESEITLRTQRAEKIGQHGAAFVFQNAAHERGAGRYLSLARPCGAVSERETPILMIKSERLNESILCE